MTAKEREDLDRSLACLGVEERIAVKAELIRVGLLQNAAESLPAQPELKGLSAPIGDVRLRELATADYAEIEELNQIATELLECRLIHTSVEPLPIEAKEDHVVQAHEKAEAKEKPSKEREQEAQSLLDSMVRDFTEFLKINAKSEVRRRIVEYAQMYSSQPSDQPTQKEHDSSCISIDKIQSLAEAISKREQILSPSWSDACDIYDLCRIQKGSTPYHPRDWSKPHLKALNYLNNCELDDVSLDITKLREILDVPENQTDSFSISTDQMPRPVEIIGNHWIHRKRDDEDAKFYRRDEIDAWLKGLR